MRILTIVFDLGAGGTQRAAQNYAVGFQRRGYDVAVFGYQGGGPRADELREAGIEVFIGSTDADAQSRALEAALRWGPHVVHIHRFGRRDKESALLMRAAKTRLTPAPVVIETNVFSRFDHTSAHRDIDVSLQLSRWCLWKWQAWASRSPSRPAAALIPYAVDTDRFFPLGDAEREEFRERHAIPREAHVFGRIGQPIVWKWSPVIFDAFHEVAADDVRTHLLLVGLPEELQPHVAALPPAVRTRVHQIDFLHGDEQLRQGYASIDTFLHAALIGESFGMVLAEAMLCERPVITLSTPLRDNSQLDVVGHGIGGLGVSDLPGMAAAMRTLAADPALRQRLGRAGRQRVQERFRLGTIMDDLERVVTHATQATSRTDLKRRLDADERLVTRVDTKYARRVLEEADAVPTVTQRLGMHLVHEPYVHRFVDLVKHGRG